MASKPLQVEGGEDNREQPLPAGDTLASRADLERLSLKVLWALCRERGITGLSKGPKPQLVEALLNHPDGTPLRSALPGKGTKGGKTGAPLAASGKARGVELAHLEQRLDRLEKLVLLIAQQVGLSPQAIAQLLAAADAPPS